MWDPLCCTPDLDPFCSSSISLYALVENYSLIHFQLLMLNRKQYVLHSILA